jgi:hypothetical protein
MKKLGRLQQEVYAALKRHGSWSLGCGWLWDTYSGTRRVLDSLVRAGYATSTEEGGSKILYRPINLRPTRRAILLSGGHAVKSITFRATIEQRAAYKRAASATGAKNLSAAITKVPRRSS